MNFQIRGLDGARFSHLFGHDDDFLAIHGARRMTVDSHPGYPCRVSLHDVEVGKTVLLMNFEHQPAATPYRSSHAIFVEEWASAARLRVNEIPQSLRIRQLSVRAFDREDMMVDADVVDGLELERVIERMLSNKSVRYLHAHNAKRGCFAARVDAA